MNDSTNGAVHDGRHENLGAPKTRQNVSLNRVGSCFFVPAGLDHLASTAWASLPSADWRDVHSTWMTSCKGGCLKVIG
jgi:hypothetical protein